MEQYLVGVDNGGTMVKAAVFDARGRMLGRAGYAYALETPQAGFAERDMEQLWRDTAGVIRRAVQESGVLPGQIAAVACTGHGKGMYLWGRDHKPVRPGIVSTDTRAQEYVAKWNQDGTAGRAYPYTLQKLLVSQPCALLAWLKAREPEAYGRIQWVFEMKDYIRFRMTGEARAEWTDYSGTGLMDLRTGDFSRELLELYGIPEMLPCLPRLAGPPEVCGVITEEAAAVTGLAKGTPVAGGMFDIDACALASGVTDGRNLCVIAGTWSINEYVSKQPVGEHKIAMNSLFCLPGYYLAEESSPTSAGNLEWLAQTVLSCDREKAEQEGKSIYSLLDSMVEETPLAEDAPLFFPYLFGAPDAPQANAVFAGFTARHGKADMVRAVFEGIVFGHREHIDRLLACRSRPEGVHLSGGAANSSVWVQMFADVLGLPVKTMALKEPGALGCAMAGAVAAGIYPDFPSAVSGMAPQGEYVQPNSRNTAVYQKKYERYQKTKAALLPLWLNL